MPVVVVVVSLFDAISCFVDPIKILKLSLDCVKHECENSLTLLDLSRRPATSILSPALTSDEDHHRSTGATEERFGSMRRFNLPTGTYVCLTSRRTGASRRLY